jgi:hypothetical protein
MKKSLQIIKSNYLDEISLAKANGFEGIMFPTTGEISSLEIMDIEDTDSLVDLAEDCGWDKFIIVNFKTKKDTFINIYELEAA